MNKREKPASARRAGSIGGAGSAKADRYFVEALARGLELLHCFGHRDKLLGNQELAQRCGLPKSTVSRLTHTLTRLGYLTYVAEVSKYALGSATLSLGSAMLGRLDIRKLARPPMQELAEFSQCTVGLTSRDCLCMIYVESVRSSATVTLSLDTGARIQIASSAAGRAYLAAVSEQERNEILDAVREIAEVSGWAHVQQGVAKALVDLRTLGVCVSFGEWRKDVNAIAVPVRPGDGLPPMSISVGAPSNVVSQEFLLEEARPRLIALANNLEKALGTAD